MLQIYTFYLKYLCKCSKLTNYLRFVNIKIHFLYAESNNIVSFLVFTPKVILFALRKSKTLYCKQIFKILLSSKTFSKKPLAELI